MLKILQISDLHILPKSTDTLLGVNTDHYFRLVLSKAHQKHGKFDLILITGDLAQHPCPDSYQRILQQLQTYQTPTLCLPGNHDDYVMMQSILATPLISCQKQFRLAAWQIICLNSQKRYSQVGELAETELDFLTATLNHDPQIPTLLAMHHHCISSECRWLDTMQISNSDALLAKIQPHKQIKAVTFGHIHQALSKQSQGIKLFSAPACCFQFQEKSDVFALARRPSGYRVFNLYDNGDLESEVDWLDEAITGLQVTSEGY